MNKSTTVKYTARCTTAWDGDTFGNKWKCGAAVHTSPEGAYAVYEDDGKGNGSLLARFASLFDARRYADLHCKFLDAGGHAGTEPHIELSRLAEARGLS